MLTSVEFCHRLRALRDAIGVSQDEFAKAMGVSRASIGYYESGQRMPDIEVLKKICDLTGCSANYLLGYSENMKEDYEAIGRKTGLSDDAIRAIGNAMHPGIVNFVVTHKFFQQLQICMHAYSLDKPPDDVDFLLRSDKGYIRHLVYDMARQIMDDYADANPPGENANIFQFAFVESLGAYKEQLYTFIEERNKEYLEQEKRFEQQGENDDEDSSVIREKDDPISRFKRKMERE